MNDYYLILVKNLKTGVERRRSFERRAAALDAWDAEVDGALPGEMLRLMDLDAGRIMSEYTPAYRGGLTFVGMGGGE